MLAIPKLLPKSCQITCLSTKANFVKPAAVRENTLLCNVSESLGQEQMFLGFLDLRSHGLRQIFQCDGLTGMELNSWWNILGLVDTVKWGSWNKSLFSKVFEQVGYLVPYAWAVYPEEENICSYKLLFKNFLKHTVNLFIGSILVFLGKNFLERMLKSCWHRRPQLS